jgi:hypothetical protein
LFSGLHLAFSDLLVLFIKANGNPNQGKTDHSVASQSIYGRIKAQNRRSLVSLDRPPGGGLPQKVGRGSSQVRMISRIPTVKRTSPIHIPVSISIRKFRTGCYEYPANKHIRGYTSLYKSNLYRLKTFSKKDYSILKSPVYFVKIKILQNWENVNSLKIISSFTSIIIIKDGLSIFYIVSFLKSVSIRKNDMAKVPFSL